MRVTFLTSHFPETSEQFIVNQIVGLIQAGIDVKILSLHKPHGCHFSSSVEEYGLLNKTECLGIPDSFFKRIIMAIPIALYFLFHKPRILLRAISWRYTTAAYSLKLLYVLKALEGKEQIPLLHCHFGWNGIVGVCLKDVGVVRQLVTTFHGSDINKYPKKFGKNVYKRLFEASDFFTANTNFTKSKLVLHGCPEEKINVLPVGLLCSKYPFIARNRYSEAGDKIRLLTVGRLVEKKGHRYVLEAIAKISDKGRRIYYSIAGEGPNRSRLEDFTNSLGLRDSVKFLGLVDNDAATILYQTVDIFVLASVTASDGDMEGQGLVLQEAQASGLPVISTLHNGIPDGVLDGISGYLVPEKDSDMLAEKILMLCQDPKKREQMGRAGREFVEKNYDIPVLTERIVDIYKRALAAKN